MVLELQEHIKLNESGEFIKVKPRKTDQLVAEIPIPHAGAPQDHRTVRSKNTRIKFVQFPINISNARTVHKLQGRTIENLMIASFDYRDNLIYVALLWVTTLKGLFLMKQLVFDKCKGMSGVAGHFIHILGKIKSQNNYLNE